MSAAAANRPSSKPVTLEDFLAIPEGERFHELVGGQLVRKAAPTYEHGGAQAALAGTLFDPFGRRAGGPPDRPGGWWIATEVEVQVGGDIYRPDVAGWRRERVAQRPSGSPVTVVPDWICEILSARSASTDTVRKMRAYHRASVGHYWLLDPQQQTLTVCRWTAEGYLNVLVAERGERVLAEPFGAIELAVAVLFGEDDE
jgi:Uma2 family endonuclease